MKVLEVWFGVVQCRGVRFRGKGAASEWRVAGGWVAAVILRCTVWGVALAKGVACGAEGLGPEGLGLGGSAGAGGAAGSPEVIA